MTDPVSAASPVASGPIVRVPNPGQEGDVFLSRAAEATLSKLSQMQSEFAKVAQANATNASVAPPQAQAASAGGHTVGADGAKPEVDLAKSMSEAARSINSAAAVQQQLAQFVVASSVSSSFGRNLNMFLRGQ